VRLIIFGPQGAGKGTQGQRIAEKYDVPAISTGDIFRWAISQESPLGLKAKQYVDAGRLVPDEVTIGVFRERLARDDVRTGFLIDGFPRNRAQAEALDEILAEQDAAVDGAIVIEVPEEISMHRLLGRRVCLKCGRNYHEDSPPKNDWTCNICGGNVVPRTDDNEDTIRERLRLYAEQTTPLKEYYGRKGVLKEIDGVGTPDEVFQRIVTVL
jgi:adenylate kinase